MPDFTPRLNSVGMLGSKWWYSTGNPFYPKYGLPNCTCYAYGRFAEIYGEFLPLPTGNAGLWYNRATAFDRGQTPALGAVACWGSVSGKYAGHVAVVEVIYDNGNIVTSNSAYRGTYFWTETLTPASGYRSSWMTRSRDYVLQGFIYNYVQPTDPDKPVWPDEPDNPGDDGTGKRIKQMPLYMMLPIQTKIIPR